MFSVPFRNMCVNLIFSRDALYLFDRIFLEIFFNKHDRYCIATFPDNRIYRRPGVKELLDERSARDVPTLRLLPSTSESPCSLWPLVHVKYEHSSPFRERAPYILDGLVVVRKRSIKNEALLV